MLAILNIKCPNCGSNLEITPEMETFACGYCGASQMVERRGGTVALRLVTDAIKQVQRGTDRTASELAIRRLKEELQDYETTYQHTLDKEKQERSSVTDQIRIGWIAVSILSFVLAITRSSAPGVTFIAVIWIIATVLLFAYQARQLSEIGMKFIDIRQNISAERERINREIDTHKSIVSN